MSPAAPGCGGVRRTPTCCSPRPRRGKGVSVIIPNLLDWPGPLVATSTKDDLIVHTACALRQERPVYVFDPTGFSEWPEPVGWDPVAGCEDPQVAIYRARALNAAAGSSQGIQHADYFQSYNEAIHRCYLHAAAVSGRDIATVRQWVNRAESHDAIRCLRESPAAPEWADDLEAITGMHDQAVSNVFSGARRAYDCLADPRVLRACQPGAGAGFNADRIITERAALFIVGTSGAQASMAPIITALIETIVNAAKQRAARSADPEADPATRALPRRVRQHRAAAVAAPARDRRCRPGHHHHDRAPVAGPGPGALGS